MSNGKLVKIAETGESPNGTKYAISLTGVAMFPRTKELDFKKGQYAYVIERKQTKSYLMDEKGERVKDEAGKDKLIDLSADQVVTQNIMTAIFDSKADAVEAVAETGLLGAEVAAAVVKGAKELNLSDATVAELAAAW